MTAFLKQKRRYERIHDLIRRKATGTPSQFARKLGVNESTLYRDLKFMKEEWDAPTVFSRSIGGYIYTEYFELLF